jgi:hypothetical protein
MVVMVGIEALEETTSVFLEFLNLLLIVILDDEVRDTLDIGLE